MQQRCLGLAFNCCRDEGLAGFPWEPDAERPRRRSHKGAGLPLRTVFRAYAVLQDFAETEDFADQLRSVGHEIVTQVLGTNRYPCLRAVQ